MKSSRNSLLAAVFCLALISGPAAGDAKDRQIFYQLLWNTDNVSGTILVNGFEITTMDGQSGSGSASLNVWLTGDNEIRADVKKADVSKQATFSVGLSKMSPGDIVDTMGKGNVFSIEKKDSDFAGGKTVTVTKKFNSPLDFSANLSKTQPADEKEIIAYAVKIHGLFMKKDADAIVKEFSAKLQDYNVAYSTDDSAGEFKAILVDELLKGKFDKIDTAKLKITAEGPGGKVWHVTQGSSELIRIVLPDGTETEMPIHVAKINGELKVVR